MGSGKRKASVDLPWPQRHWDEHSGRQGNRKGRSGAVRLAGVRTEQQGDVRPACEKSQEPFYLSCIGVQLAYDVGSISALQHSDSVYIHTYQFSSVQSLIRVQPFVTPWTAAGQASPSTTNFRSLLKLMSIKLVMPSNHITLYRPLLLSPSIFSNIRVFSSESVICIRWPKHWSFSFSISLSNEYSGLISFRMDWLDPSDSVYIYIYIYTHTRTHCA